jgi:hypothetical protein
MAVRATVSRSATGPENRSRAARRKSFGIGRRSDNRQPSPPDWEAYSRIRPLRVLSHPGALGKSSCAVGRLMTIREESPVSSRTISTVPVSCGFTPQSPNPGTGELGRYRRCCSTHSGSLRQLTCTDSIPSPAVPRRRSRCRAKTHPSKKGQGRLRHPSDPAEYAIQFRNNFGSLVEYHKSV